LQKKCIILNLKFVIFLEVLEKAGFNDHHGNHYLMKKQISCGVSFLLNDSESCG
jgi:hypothetical protein